MSLKSYLLLDFGASRIKSAILSDGQISDICSYGSVKPEIYGNSRYEIKLSNIKDTFFKIADSSYKKKPFDAVLICSEMHGFALLNNNNEPVSNYISWKDERSADKSGGASSFEILSAKLGGSFFQKTAMKPRACYPIFNFFHMLRNNEIGKTKDIKMVSLPEWLCACGGNSSGIAHNSMSAGLGFYNIYTGSFDEELIKAATENSVNLSFNEPSADITAGGTIEIQGKEIPVYTGVGDHQCAVLGAGNDETSVSVNLGTGSQVAIVSGKNDISEKRPFFNGKLLSVITHIPSGRALNKFIDFLESVNPSTDFWKEFDKITFDEVAASDLNIDLALFESAWNYSGGGAVSGINESNFNLKNYMASLLRCYMEQYKKAIESLSASGEYDKIILSGGIAAKIAVLKTYIGSITGCKVYIFENAYDETFAGLNKISGWL